MYLPPGRKTKTYFSRTMGNTLSIICEIVIILLQQGEETIAFAFSGTK